ncbi:MAG: inositol monophosphatase [Roseiarcus sp.]
MPFSLGDLHHVGGLLASAAEAEIMPRFRNLSPVNVREKSSAFDVVTEVDEAAEAVLAEALRAAFPRAIIIGEEGAERDPGLLQSLASAELVFVVDPIDGTKNFTARLPMFGLMAAATIRGEVVGGVIYDPVNRDWAYALRGEGAWLQAEDGTTTDLRVAAPVSPAEMHAVAGTNFLPEPLRSTVSRNLPKIGMNFWLRCAAHEYRMAAAGHCHLLVYNRLMP